MIISVASGKGGTGKTTVATNLALVLDEPSIFLDCDVEEPNAALFLSPTLAQQERVGIWVPRIDEAICTRCGRCSEVCRYNALAVTPTKVLVFDALCHGCGSCTINCPQGAIEEAFHATGALQVGVAGPKGEITFGHGILDVGQAMAPPVIRALKKQMIPKALDTQTIILDAPPGTSCPVVETMKGSDLVLMVTEPTPFGLHDLRLAVQAARDELSLPIAVVINRAGIGDQCVDDFCATEDIPILMRIPFDRRIAETYSDGVPLVQALPIYRPSFSTLLARIAQVVKSGRNQV
jgi:MinD superfamily P-loop ATPase